MSDLISRQQAIDALCKSECGCNNAECGHRDNTDFCVTCDNVKIIKSLPSVQPETNCSEIPNNSDTISRQAAIDEIHEDAEWLASQGSDWQTERMERDKSILMSLPSIQPETNCSEIPNNWIPCSERLPEDEYVLISKKPTKISGDKWSVAIAIRTADPRSRKIQWRDSGFGVIQDDKVLAWLPLPEPYQGGEQE